MADREIADYLSSEEALIVKVRDVLQIGGVDVATVDDIITLNITTETADYTVLPTDYVVLVDATAGDITVTLPDASTLSKIFYVKRIDDTANIVTISSSQFIDDDTASLVAPYSTIGLIPDTTGYWLL